MNLSRRDEIARRALGASLITACVVLSACSSSSTGPSNTGGSPKASSASLHSLLPAALSRKGTLVVASDIEYPPFESYAANNTTVVGVDRDIADQLQRLLGITLRFQNTAFDAIIPGLASGRYDMAMSAEGDTRTREKQVDFVDYFNGGGTIMVPGGNPRHLRGVADLCGLKVGIDKGTTQVQDGQAQSKKCVSAGKQPLDISVYASENQMVLALQSGRADAIYVDSATGPYVAKQSNGAFTLLTNYYTTYRYGIVFPKGSAPLEKAVEAALTMMRANGSYLTILKKYGVQNGAVSSFPVNDGTPG